MSYFYGYYQEEPETPVLMAAEEEGDPLAYRLYPLSTIFSLIYATGNFWEFVVGGALLGALD